MAALNEQKQISFNADLNNVVKNIMLMFNVNVKYAK